MENDALKLSEKVKEDQRTKKKYPWEPDETEFDELEEQSISIKEILMFSHNS